MIDNSETLKNSDVVKSKYTAREELRILIHQTVGDSEQLFSADSDLLQLLATVMVKLFSFIKNKPDYQEAINTIDSTTLGLFNHLSKAINSEQISLPIKVKSKYKIIDEIAASMTERYSKTAALLNDYYQAKS
ncbi:hypothetical protein L3V79_09020 [Thiotrichales bacterium 19S9-12]|nr:hypothetical protein [Thiotrichales bacterium 19S9-11]MCF6812498.1 hypothetical protein [Thiotrichales bacterium 19S9-12]